MSISVRELRKLLEEGVFVWRKVYGKVVYIGSGAS